jgi:hypothetical protein
LVSKSGAFYTIKGQKAQGKEKAMQLIMEDKKLREEIEKDIQTKIKEMRIGKTVLDEKALETLEASVEEADDIVSAE